MKTIIEKENKNRKNQNKNEIKQNTSRKKIITIEL